MFGSAKRLREMDVQAEAGDEVREAFAALDIRPFTSASVAAYKQAMLHKHRMRWYDWLARAIERLVPLDVFCGGLIRCSLGLVLAVVVLFVGARLFGIEIGWLKWVTFGGTTSAVVLNLASALISIWDYRTTEPDWLVVGPIGECTGVVGCPHCFAGMPLPVARVADRVLSRLPGATVFAEVLWQDTRLDPFLVVRYKGREFHIAVWDEEGYAPEFDDAT